MRIQRLQEQIQNEKIRDVTFDEFSALLKAKGFRFDRTSEGYWVFVHPSLPGTLAVQASDCKIKPFQVLHLLRILEKYDLAVEE